jgi:hypothetical protein
LFDPSFAGARGGARLSQSLIHHCRLRGNQKIESLAMKQQMKIAEIFRTDFEGKISSQQQCANSSGLFRVQDRSRFEDSVSLATADYANGYTNCQGQGGQIVAAGV